MRIGLVGCGQHGAYAVAQAVQKSSKKTKLVAVADLDLEKTQRISEVARYADYREMISREKLDLLYIATLTETHPSIAIDAFKAGLHVVCEKPMADSVSACQTMVEQAQQYDRKLLVTFETRFYPYLQKIREWVQAGYLGRVEALHLQSFWDGHKVFGEDGARRLRLMERAGCLDCGIHKLDIARYLCGGGSWKSINALGAWFDERVEKPPHISILGRLDNGILVTLNESFAYAAYIKPRPMSEILTMLGTRGVVTLAIDADSVEQYWEQKKYNVRLFSDEKEERFEIIHSSHSDPIGQILDTLAESLETNNPLPPELATGEDGLIAQIALEQANSQAVNERKVS